MKRKQFKLNVADFDDEALEILYQWANNAVLCGTAQVQNIIPAILTEYEQRRAQKEHEKSLPSYKVKINGMWVKEYLLSRVNVSDKESDAYEFTCDINKLLDIMTPYFTENDVEIIPVKKGSSDDR